MGTLTSSSSSSEPQSPLLPLQQHHNVNSPSATAVDPTTTDPPPPRSSLSAVDHQYYNVSRDPTCTECSITILLFALFFGGLWTVLSYGESKPYSPSADVISAFVSIEKNNGSTGHVGRLLTANWAVTLHLDSSTFCCQAVHPYRIEASIFQAAGNDSSSSAGGGGHQYLLASTRRFTGSTAKPGQDHTTFSIQLRAEEADVGEHAVADVMEAVEENRLRFKLLVLVWVRVNGRYYLARIGCDPVWIESYSITGNEFRKNTNKCQVQVTSQTKPMS
ncbi:unnamed protein product [Linum tenue]|uniref:Uncharacterized protein n=1 Tax=Linum tenue TaxID=586396 RepID=A0AAV0N6Y6_9ROSI|nr:unnamed protein product [Linum tenue]